MLSLFFRFLNSWNSTFFTSFVLFVLTFVWNQTFKRVQIYFYIYISVIWLVLLSKVTYCGRHNQATMRLRPLWIKYCLTLPKYRLKVKLPTNRAEIRREELRRDERRQISAIRAGALPRALSWRAFWMRSGSALPWQTAEGHSAIEEQGMRIIWISSPGQLDGFPGDSRAERSWWGLTWAPTRSFG